MGTKACPDSYATDTTFTMEIDSLASFGSAARINPSTP